MSPNLARLYAELPDDEVREDRRWRRAATPEQLKKADDLTDLWYQCKDEAVKFQKMIEALMERSFDTETA